jgi:hypothetical protein
MGRGGRCATIFEVGIDINQMLRSGARYRDKRQLAENMWRTIVKRCKTSGLSRCSGAHQVLFYSLFSSSTKEIGARRLVTDQGKSVQHDTALLPQV